MFAGGRDEASDACRRTDLARSSPSGRTLRDHAVGVNCCMAFGGEALRATYFGALSGTTAGRVLSHDRALAVAREGRQSGTAAAHPKAAITTAQGTGSRDMLFNLAQRFVR